MTMSTQTEKSSLPKPAPGPNSPALGSDVEPNTATQLNDGVPSNPEPSALKALGWLDRLLALWILLAMAIGIILGNFVPGIGPALQQGKFVDVSIPIGKKVSSCSSQPPKERADPD